MITPSGYQLLKAQAPHMGRLAWHAVLIKLSEARCCFTLNSESGELTLGDLRAPDWESVSSVLTAYMRTSKRRVYTREPARLIEILQPGLDYQLSNQVTSARELTVRGLDSIRAYCANNVLNQPILYMDIS